MIFKNGKNSYSHIEQVTFGSGGRSFFNIKPIPANRDMQLSYQLVNPSRDMVIKMENIMGQAVLLQRLDVSQQNSGQSYIDISSLETGMYFLEILIDQEKYYSKKIIIQR